VHTVHVVLPSTRRRNCASPPCGPEPDGAAVASSGADRQDGARGRAARGVPPHQAPFLHRPPQHHILGALAEAPSRARDALVQPRPLAIRRGAVLHPPQHAHQLHGVGQGERVEALPHLLDPRGDAPLRRDAVLVGEADGLPDERVGLWARGRGRRGLADGVRDGHEGGELGDQVRVGERGEVLGVGGGVREQEEELQEPRGEPDPRRGGEGGPAERERRQRERVAPGGRVPGERGEELVAEDERAPRQEDPERHEALESHGGVALPRSRGAQAVHERRGERRGGEARAPSEGQERVHVLRGRRRRARVVSRRAPHRVVRVGRGARGCGAWGEEGGC
jgi:hypothetical protein